MRSTSRHVSGLVVELGEIAAAELVPPGRVVPEPLAQRGGGREVLEPAVQAQRFLLTPRGQSRSTSRRAPSDGAGAS